MTTNPYHTRWQQEIDMSGISEAHKTWLAEYNYAFTAENPHMSIDDAMEQWYERRDQFLADTYAPGLIQTPEQLFEWRHMLNCLAPPAAKPFGREDCARIVGRLLVLTQKKEDNHD